MGGICVIQNSLRLRLLGTGRMVHYPGKSWEMTIFGPVRGFFRHFLPQYLKKHRKGDNLWRDRNVILV